MKSALIKTFLLLGILTLFTTCTKDIWGPDACFKEDVLPIFISNCTYSGCHNSAKGESRYDLTNYDGIMKGITPKHPLRSEIYSSIKGKNPSMPQSPYPKLNQKDITTIKLWIEMGAKNTSNCKVCDTTDFKYSTRVKVIMDKWCIGCHNPGNSGGGYDLSDYNGVLIAITANRLLGSLKHSGGFSAMPKNSDQLSQCDIDAIEKWINTGYKNN